ncbi:MAG: hypothetical protein J7K98_00170 [Candidatus Aenigmarchaeota archaeon]|nr:hypothetical protein [Candidatus Aenigmarchaeota archaeon]
MKIKKLLPIPVALFIFSLLVLFNNYKTYGEFIQKDIDLKGGTLITIETYQPLELDKVESELAKTFGSVIVSGLKSLTGYGATIQVSSDVHAEDVIKVIENMGIKIRGYSVETVGPALGEAFWYQIVKVLVGGFVFMGIMVFLIYRSPVPSFAIVITSIANILTTVALVNIIGLKISFPGFAALLMVLSYTVDTNIVLTTKSLRSGKKGFEQTYKTAFSTAFKIIIAVVASMSVMLLVPTSRVIVDIAIILIIGLLNDLVYTWILNASILEIYIEGMKK